MVTLVAVVSATYAWYIYNTSRHTTNVRMAAGAGSNLQISNSYDGTYGSAAVLESFAGRLTPVSTNRISGGFQKVERFTEGSDSQPDLVASILGAGSGRTTIIRASICGRPDRRRIFIWPISVLRTAMRTGRSLRRSVSGLVSTSAGAADRGCG